MVDDKVIEVLDEGGVVRNNILESYVFWEIELRLDLGENEIGGDLEGDVISEKNGDGCVELFVD